MLFRSSFCPLLQRKSNAVNGPARAGFTKTGGGSCGGGSILKITTSRRKVWPFSFPCTPWGRPRRGFPPFSFPTAKRCTQKKKRLIEFQPLPYSVWMDCTPGIFFRRSKRCSSKKPLSSRRANIALRVQPGSELTMLIFKIFKIGRAHV